MKAIKHKRQQLLRVVLLKAIETWCILPNSPLHTQRHMHDCLGSNETVTHAASVQSQQSGISPAQRNFWYCIITDLAQRLKASRTNHASSSNNAQNFSYSMCDTGD